VDTLGFGAIAPNSSSTQYLPISNVGKEVLKATITVSSVWISVDPAYIETESDSNVSITVTAPPQGSYSGFLYINSNGGASTVTVTVEATCVIPAPNPCRLSDIDSFNFRGSGISDTGYTTIKIYTINGELVRTIGAPNGAGVLHWDGKNSAGKTVVPGIYFYTHTSPVEKGSGKFTVIK